jgi:hypothetical protein
MAVRARFEDGTEVALVKPARAIFADGVWWAVADGILVKCRDAMEAATLANDGLDDDGS